MQSSCARQNGDDHFHCRGQPSSCSCLNFSSSTQHLGPVWSVLPPVLWEEYVAIRVLDFLFMFTLPLLHWRRKNPRTLPCSKLSFERDSSHRAEVFLSFWVISGWRRTFDMTPPSCSINQTGGLHPPNPMRSGAGRVSDLASARLGNLSCPATSWIWNRTVIIPGITNAPPPDQGIGVNKGLARLCMEMPWHRLKEKGLDVFLTCSAIPLILLLW